MSDKAFDQLTDAAGPGSGSGVPPVSGWTIVDDYGGNQRRDDSEQKEQREKEQREREEQEKEKREREQREKEQREREEQQKKHREREERERERKEEEKRKRLEYLRTAPGQQWLQSEEFKALLKTEEGREWLPLIKQVEEEIVEVKKAEARRVFLEMLETPEGWKWLVSPEGQSWLQSLDGQFWLDEKIRQELEEQTRQWSEDERSMGLAAAKRGSVEKLSFSKRLAAGRENKKVNNSRRQYDMCEKRALKLVRKVDYSPKIAQNLKSVDDKPPPRMSDKDCKKWLEREWDSPSDWKAYINQARSNLNVKSEFVQLTPTIRSWEGFRSAPRLQAVIDQFNVMHNDFRYRPSDEEPWTRCNIFAGDVFRAMGVPLPTKGEIDQLKNGQLQGERDRLENLGNKLKEEEQSINNEMERLEAERKKVSAEWSESIVVTTERILGVTVEKSKEEIRIEQEMAELEKRRESNNEDRQKCDDDKNKWQIKNKMFNEERMKGQEPDYKPATDPMTAKCHELCTVEGAMNGWKKIYPANKADLQLLIDYVNAGKPALAICPTHIAPILPYQSDVTDWTQINIAQAGRHNYERCTIAKGFGDNCQDNGVAFYIRE